MADCNEERRSARRPRPRAPLLAAQAALVLSSLSTVALAQTPPSSALAPPWQRPTDAAGTLPSSPPPPPGATSPVASEPRPSAGPPLVARVELVSDDTPVEVYVVTGTREQLQFVSVPTAPSPSTMGFGLGMPFGGGAMIAPIGSTNYAPSELIEARTTVETRRFLCSTPCAVSLPEGPLSLHLRTLGAALGTETVQLRPGATRFRVRTAATGLYTIGQALLWVGAGLAVTGASLIVQSQTGCGPGGCTPWPGALTTGAGVLSMAIGIPLVVLYSRRLEAIGARSVAVGPGVVRLAF